MRFASYPDPRLYSLVCIVLTRIHRSGRATVTTIHGSRRVAALRFHVLPLFHFHAMQSKEQIDRSGNMANMQWHSGCIIIVCV